MRTTFVAAVVILTANLSLAAPSPESTGNNSDSSALTVASNGHHGGSGGSHLGGGSHPAGVSRTPAVHPGGNQPQSRTYRPAPWVNSGRPSPSNTAIRQRSTTIQRPQTRSGVSRRATPTRPEMSRQNPEATRRQPRISRPTTMLHQPKSAERSVLTTRDGRAHKGNWSRHDPANRDRFDRQTQGHLRNWQGRKSNFSEACHNHNDHHRHHHDRNWWHHHCNAVVLVDWGFWGWSGGWWYPAWGYDPYYSYYEYDGPIYGYDGLPPDEIVANVQSALQDFGYYLYEVDGILGPLTQEALARFQQDYGIPVTGAIDPQTLASLGLT